jgi:hypothetical protein
MNFVKIFLGILFINFFLTYSGLSDNAKKFIKDLDSITQDNANLKTSNLSKLEIIGLVKQFLKKREFLNFVTINFSDKTVITVYKEA